MIITVKWQILSPIYFQLVLILGILLCLNHLTVAQEEAFTAIAWSANGETLAIGGNNGSEGILIFYDFSQQSFTKALIPGEVSRLAWSMDNLQLAVRFKPKGASSQILVWDFLQSRAIVMTEEFGSSGFYNLIKWSPDNRFIAVDTATTILVFDSSTGSAVAALYDKERIGNNGPIEFNWSTDSQFIYALYDIRVQEEILIWDVTTSNIVQAFDVSTSAINFALSPDTKYLAINDIVVDSIKPTESSVIIADALKGDILRILPVPAKEDEQSTLQKLIWSSDASKLIGITNQGIVYVWQASDGELIDTIYSITDSLSAFSDASLSPNGGQLAIINMEGYLPPPSQAKPLNYDNKFSLEGDKTISIIVPIATV